MSELLREFERLLGASPEGTAASSISVLLQIMEPASARLLRLCAIPHEFSPGVLQALLPGMGDEAAAAACRELAELSVVSSVAGELSLHSIARAELFAWWLLPERRSELVEASHRLVAYYEKAGAAAAAGRKETLAYRRMFHLLGAEPSAGFAEFERLCRAAHREHSLSVCAILINLVHEYDALLAPEMVVALTYHEAKLASDLRDFERAEQLLGRVLADPAVSPELRAKALLRQGFISCSRRDFPRAIEAYRSALLIAESLSGTSIQVHHVLASLSEAYRDSGDLATAEKLLRQSLAGAERAGDQIGMASAHNDLGTMLFLRREAGAAVAEYQQSLASLERAGSRFRAAQVYNNLSMVYTELGDLDTADRFYLQSLAVKRETGDMLGQATSLLNRVRILRLRGDVPQAMEVCQEAIGLFATIRDVYRQAEAQRTLGRMYAAGQDEQQARAALTGAAELFERCRAVKEAVELRRELDQLGRKLGIPWWVWLPIVLFVLLLAAIFVLEARH